MLNNKHDVLNYSTFCANQDNSTHISLYLKFPLVLIIVLILDLNNSQFYGYFSEFNLFKILKEIAKFLTYIDDLSLRVFYYTPFDIPRYKNHLEYNSFFSRYNQHHFQVLLRMLYELVFYLNLDIRIFSKLCMITIITLNELCTNSLDKPLVSRSVIFFFDFT